MSLLVERNTCFFHLAVHYQVFLVGGVLNIYAKNIDAKKWILKTFKHLNIKKNV